MGVRESAVRVTTTVGDAEPDALTLADVETLALKEEVAQPLREGEIVGEPDTDADAPAVADTDELTVAENDGLSESEVDGVAESDDVRLRIVTEYSGDGETDADEEIDCDAEAQ